MAEPSTTRFGAPSRRSAGRLGPVVLLVLGVLALAAMTHAQALDRAGSPEAAPADPAAGAEAGAAPVAYAFGSVTATGAVVFRLGEPVHAWVVDAAGAPRWSRDLDAGDAVACGPCPEAVVSHADGRVELIQADGSPAPAPAEVADGVVATRSLVGVVVAAARPDGAVEFLVPRHDGLESAGSLADPRLDQPLIVVTPAARGRAVTVLRASSDPLRQAEFEVVHLTPAGSSLRTVELDAPGARPFPCAVADEATVAYLQQLRGPTADGSTHLVVRGDDGDGLEATVAGSFDLCAAGPDGAVLASVVTGADGDPTHTVVAAVWLGPTLEVRATTSEPVAAGRAVVAVDPPTGRVAVAGGPGPGVVLDGDARRELPPAAAVAFDDRGGLWWVDADARVTHEVAGWRASSARRRPVTLAPVVEVAGLAIASRRRRIGPFDLTVRVGEVVGLVGPNGSGKTSCLRLALGLDPASVGTSRVHGAVVSPWRPPLGVGLVLEADGCYPWLSGRDNLAVFAVALGGTAAEVASRLEECGLGPAADRPVRSYSRGMRQRLAIARARLGDPPLLVLDEPTVALDAAATAWLIDVLGAHVQAGGSVLAASHDLTFLDALDARRVVIDAGEVTVLALTLARSQRGRPTVRVVAVVAVLAGAWGAWSPGTRFGLSGALGGWQFGGRHLLDIGLVLLAVAGALTGAASRERGLDEQLHAAGVSRCTTLGATVAAGAWVGVTLAVGFALATAAGGLLRSVTRGGSSWIDPGRALGVAPSLLTVGRLGLAAALVGALAALIGWVARRDDLGCAVVVVLALPGLEQTSALLGRLPAIITGWSYTPWGALRTVALADRGLPAPGYDRPSGVVTAATVLLGWIALLVVLALPPSAGRGGSTAVGTGAAPDADRRAPSRVPTAPSPGGRRRLRPTPAAAAVVVAVALTLGAGATMPSRLARSLPWRWQRSWRDATHEGWSSTQTVDRVVAGIRDGPDADLADRVARADALAPAVADSLRRADRVDRQPESSMRAPDQVTVRLHFDHPVASGRVAFADYLVRFSLEVDGSGRWHVVRTEGPVASAAVDRDVGAGR